MVAAEALFVRPLVPARFLRTMLVPALALFELAMVLWCATAAPLPRFLRTMLVPAACFISSFVCMVRHSCSSPAVPSNHVGTSRLLHILIRLHGAPQLLLSRGSFEPCWYQPLALYPHPFAWCATAAPLPRFLRTMLVPAACFISSSVCMVRHSCSSPAVPSNHVGTS